MLILYNFFPIIFFFIFIVLMVIISPDTFIKNQEIEP